MYQPVPLQRRLPGKLLRHDQQLEVPFAAATNVASVRRTVVANLQPDGVKRILHHGADSFNPVTASSGARHVRVSTPARCPRCSHRAWPIARAASAMVRPKTLK